MNTKEFVQKCGELLVIAKPHLVKAEYKLGSEIPSSSFKRIIPDAEYAVVTCENGHTYEIDITANSLNSIAEAIFHATAYK